MAHAPTRPMPSAVGPSEPQVGREGVVDLVVEVLGIADGLFFGEQETFVRGHGPLPHQALVALREDTTQRAARAYDRARRCARQGREEGP